MARAATSVVLIGRHRIVRADYRSRGGDPVGFWSADRPDIPTLDLLTETALLLGPKPGSRVIVLSTDVWSQLVRLDASATAMVEPKDMARVLAFEIEPLSNIAAFDSALHFVPIDQNAQYRNFWVNSIPAGDLRDVTAIVRRLGSQLVGVAHPGGVTMGTKEAWQRIEFWPDLVLGVNVDSAGQRSLLSINVDPRQSGWEAEVEKWRSEVGRPSRREIVYYDDTFPGAVDDIVPLDLNDDDNLGKWLSHWATSAGVRKPFVPIVRSPRRPLTLQERWFIAIGLAAFVALAAFGHSRYVSSRLKFMESEIERFTQPAKTLANIEKTCNERTKQIATKTAEAQSVESDLRECKEVLSIRQRRISDLLEVLVASRPEHVVVRRIDVTTNQVAVHGLALEPELSDILATELEAQLSAMSWNIDPAHQIDQLWLGDGGPWEFQIRLLDRKVEWSAGLPSDTPVILGDL